MKILSDLWSVLRPMLGIVTRLFALYAANRLSSRRTTTEETTDSSRSTGSTRTSSQGETQRGSTTRSSTSTSHTSSTSGGVGNRGSYVEDSVAQREQVLLNLRTHRMHRPLGAVGVASNTAMCTRA